MMLQIKFDGYVCFRFLRGIAGSTFDWPRRDGIDTVHPSCIFFGQVKLVGHVPFNFLVHELIKKVSLFLN